MRSRGVLVEEAARSFRLAAWLGWQIESNWTDPLLFAIYSLAKPVAGALILVFMYAVIAHGGLDNPLFPQIFIGNAFYIFVGSVMTGVSWAVIDDREHYKTLKYIYTAPLNLYAYLLGRGVAKAATSAAAVVITLLVGILGLGIAVVPATVDWGLLTAALLLGLGVMAFLGILLGGVSLVMARHSFFVGEVVAGALFLVSGAVFPIDVLPGALRMVACGVPFTYWLEALRRALLGRGASDILAGISDLGLLGILCLALFALVVLSVGVFRVAEHRAKERGLIDMDTMY